MDSEISNCLFASEVYANELRLSYFERLYAGEQGETNENFIKTT